jgi:O-acetyl-ADP-ribose deacetylase (regulator of RNase III)
LPAQFVIHTVGPIYGRDQASQADLLGACYKNSLSLASENNVRTIAFPSISTGAFGYPRAEAATICSAAIQQFLAANIEFEQVQLVFFHPSDLRVFLQYQIFG